MKKILYMAMTVNGIIAKDDDSADFLTPTEAESYVSNVCQAGALIVGRRTYEVLSEQPEFQKFVVKGINVVAVSTGNTLELKDPSHRIAQSPEEAVEMLNGSEKVIIAGGGKLDASFMKAGLIDELYLDIEPALVGQGIPLFNGEDFDVHLKFLDYKMLSENEIQLHYEVVK